MPKFRLVAAALIGASLFPPTTQAESPGFYRVEVVFVHDGEVFLGQQTLPAEGDEPLRAVAFDDGGKPLAPPDPNFARPKRIQMLEIRRASDPPPPPAAETTSYYRVKGGRRGIAINASDEGTALARLPAPGRAPVLQMFRGVLFRVEHVDERPPPLLQDRDHYERRVPQILAEVREQLGKLRSD